MKNFPIRALLLASLMLVFSCKSDDGGDTPPEEDPRAENLKTLGASAAELLSNDAFQSLTVEFVYAEGFRPQQATLDQFRTFLEERVNKPGGIRFVETLIDPPPGAPYNSQEIRDIEDANRTQFTNGTNIAVYVFFSNGNAFGDTQTSFTLGSAYRNTSIVVYRKTLVDIVLQDPDFDLEILEGTTLNHEFGHIFGLVNILDDDIHNSHEDTVNRRHCIVEECLMFFEAQAAGRSMLSRMKSLNTIPVFDTELCIQDLQSKGGK